MTATASSYDKATTTPANTVNGSGLTGDLHGIATDTMWISSMTGPTPVWIQYQFDKVYKLSELWVWNHNTEFEPVLGYGLKDVTIENSLDGTTWTLLKDVQFAQAQASGRVRPQHHRGPGRRHGPVRQAHGQEQLEPRGPQAVRLERSAVLLRPRAGPGAAARHRRHGRQRGCHAGLAARPRCRPRSKVYFGTDKAAVTDGTAPAQTVTNHGFDPGALDFGTTYYWKVDEVGTATYPGAVWKLHHAGIRGRGRLRELHGQEGEPHLRHAGSMA